MVWCGGPTGASWGPIGAHWGLLGPVWSRPLTASRKAAKVLASFVKPNQMLGVDQVIPPEILQNAKGLAVITVLKAGFLFSGRAGSGVIVARLPDGTWSPPSAIVTAGAGAGGQVGIELTDFVFILNTREAVESFAQAGSITFGGNISVAAGPLGRNAEAGGTASLKSAAAIFAYSKTKGLFAGVSVEGSAIVERREANRKFYGNNCKAKQILSGRVDAPPECDYLFRVLNSRAFTRRRARGHDDDYDDGYDDAADSYYNDIPDFSSDTASESDRRSYNRSSYRRRAASYSDDSQSDDSDDDYYNRSSSRFNRGSARHASWEDDVYDRDSRARSSRARASNRDSDDLTDRFSRASLSNPKRAPPTPTSSSVSKYPKAIALYSFAGEQAGDLPFKKGDVISILKKSDSTNDWWTGKCNGREGIFPANYVELA